MKSNRLASMIAAFALGCALTVVGVPVASASPTCPTGQIETGGACAPCKKLKPCYDGAGEMYALTNQIIPMINSFVSTVYLHMPDVKQYLLIPSGQSVTGCGGTLDSTTTFMHCTDGVIYLGADQMWQFYSDYSDAAVGIGIVHEYGHHVQHAIGANMTEALGLEEQADCFAGAWSQYEMGTGVMTSIDLVNVGDFIPLIASSENNPNRDHGSIQERIGWYNAGFNGGLAACNVPGYPPLITR